MSFIKRIYKSFMGAPIYLVLFGLVFFGIGSGLTYQQRTFERQGMQAHGQVVSMTESCNDDGCAYAPLVRFKTQNGQDIAFQSSYYSSPPQYDVGESVEVIYSLENPEKAVIQGEGQLFRIIFMIVGGIVSTVGLGMFAANIRNSFLEQV